MLSRKGSPEDQARFLTYFRADSIVKDCEMVRKEVVKGTDQRWSVLGQSFGGFCCMTYLSLYPSSTYIYFLLHRQMYGFRNGRIAAVTRRSS